MLGINKVILIGYVGQDPSIRYLENGRTQATFSLATHDVYKNKEGQKVQTVEWHRIVLWTPWAEMAETYVNKGKKVYLEGKLTHRAYRDKGGAIKELTEIVVDKLVLLSGAEVVEDETQKGMLS